MITVVSCSGVAVEVTQLGMINITKVAEVYEDMHLVPPLLPLFQREEAESLQPFSLQLCPHRW